jgi:hypothetical protein
VERVIIVSTCRISTHMECHNIGMVLQQGTAGRGTLFHQARFRLRSRVSMAGLDAT